MFGGFEFDCEADVLLLSLDEVPSLLLHAEKDSNATNSVTVNPVLIEIVFCVFIFLRFKVLHKITSVKVRQLLMQGISTM